MSFFYYDSAFIKSNFVKNLIMKTHQLIPSLTFQNFALFSIYFLFVTGISAQNSKLSSNKFPLAELTGYSQTYYYSNGEKTRATEIATLMENAGKFFEVEIKFTPHTEMYILSPEDWKTFAAPRLRNVYGFPHNIDEVHLAVAAQDNDFWRSFLPNSEKLPFALQMEIANAYKRNDESYSMKPFFDLLAIHEAGHSYTAQAGLKLQRFWMGELFVNLMLHTFIAEKKPELLPALEAFPNMVASGGASAFKYTTLGDFEK